MIIIYGLILVLNILSINGEDMLEFERGGFDISYLGARVFQKPNNLSSFKVRSWKAGNAINPEFLGTYVEGDILYPESDYYALGMINETKRWPVGIVPYEIDETAFTEQEKSYIFKAMNEFRSQSCIRFLKREVDDDSWILIKGEKYGCYSSIGRRGGLQTVNLEPPNCLRLGTILHEFMHVLGFGHENARSDRDDYITIYPENIEKGREIDFEKSSSEHWRQFGIYDYKSIMHYPSIAFSKNGINTVISKDHFTDIQQSNYFTRDDILKIVRMYNCRSLSVKIISKNIVILLILSSICYVF